MALRRGAALLAGLVLFGLALWPRWRLLPVSSALGDAVGPWWVAARGELFTTPHAPPYGWLLAAVYRPLLALADSLWTAQAGLLALHALAAPVALLLLRRLGAGWPVALVAGLAAAVDPGLLDTAQSGAETYLAPVFLGLLAACVVGERPRPLLAGLCFAAAVHHHPLALCAAPLLLVLPWERRSAWALFGPALLLGPHLLGLPGQPTGLGEGAADAPLQALSAWGRLAGVQALLVGGALILGLFDPRSRRLTLGCLASLAALVLAGLVLGTLRDHHLRLLLLPALGGLALLRGPWVLLALLCLRMPADPVERDGATRRPGTHAQLARITAALAELPPGPLVVDGVWVSGTPAAEAGAVLLDLHLRGRDQLGPDGLVALIISAEPAALDALPAATGLREVHADRRHRVLVGTEDAAAAWLAEVCTARRALGLPPPRLGGAFDALAALSPGLPAARVQAWHGGCSETAPTAATSVDVDPSELGCPEGMVLLGGSGVLGLPEGTYAVVQTADRQEVRAPESECPAALAAQPEARACWVQTDLVDPVLRPRPVTLAPFCVEAFPFPGEGVPYTTDGMTAWDTAQLDSLLRSGSYGPRRLCTATEVQAAAAGLASNQPFVYGERHDPSRCPLELTAEDGTIRPPRIGQDPRCRNAETGVHEVGAVVSHWAVADADFLAHACDSPPCRGAGNNVIEPGHYVVVGGTGRLQTRQAPLTPHTWHDHGQPSPTGCDKMGHDDQPLICATPQPGWRDGVGDGVEDAALSEADARWAELVGVARETGRVAAALELGLGRSICSEDTAPQ